MDWFWKAAISAASVLIVLAAARRCGPRVGGFVAAMPWITAPALGWLAHEEGVAFAVRAAVGSVAACAMLSAFAFLYAVACRRSGIAVALLAGSAGAVVMALPTMPPAAIWPSRSSWRSAARRSRVSRCAVSTARRWSARLAPAGRRRWSRGPPAA